MPNQFIKKLLSTTIELWDNPHFYARTFNIQPGLHQLIESTFDESMFEYAILTGDATLLKRADVEYAKPYQELHLLQEKDGTISHTTLDLTNPEGDYSDWRNWTIENKDEFDDHFPVYSDTSQVPTGTNNLAYHCNKTDKVGARMRIKFDNDNSLELKLLRHEPEDPRTMFRFYAEYAVQRVSGEMAHFYLLRSLMK